MIMIKVGFSPKEEHPDVYFVATDNYDIAEAAAKAQLIREGKRVDYKEARLANIKVLVPYNGLTH